MGQSPEEREGEEISILLLLTMWKTSQLVILFVNNKHKKQTSGTKTH